MSKKPGRAGAAGLLRPWWIVVGLLILVIIVFGVNAFVRGAGEAAGVTQAAPGDDNATPAAETVQHDDQ